ncbi:MAG: aspartate aminotransferase family protein [Candidatus Eisenbacteria sp.]|nr:aspartate aminotransferase family protein [Candidatus Eisenbacteria bacterium]
MDRKTILEKHKRFLFPSAINYYAEPVAFARGAGARLTDTEGREYLDFFAGILTVSVGHCHPRVVERVAEQLGTLQHTSTLYPNEWIVALAEKMASISTGRLSQSFFSASGTEADETAILLAHTHAGGAGDIVALRHCYAGRSLLAINVGAHAPWRIIPSMIPGIKHAHAPYCYRCALGLTYPACGLQCAHDIEELIATETCGRIAGFIAEPILGVGGFIVPPKEYFATAVEIVRRHGGIFICDEVQTGFGRTGGKMNGIEQWGVEPDVATYAKGIANGLPLGATIATPAVAASLEGLSISTFGGNPVCAVAALATIEVIESEGLVARSAVLGEQLARGLEQLAAEYPWVGETRGMGLMQALELVADPQTKEPSPERAKALMEEAREEGLLIGKGGLYGNVLRIAPPMAIGEAEVAEALEKLGRAMSRIE